MSEIAKCPLCGNTQVEILNENTIPNGAYCCGVRCDSAEKWNRYAAAMELAKAEVSASNAVWSVPLERIESVVEASEDMLFQARMRVLEVFK